MESIGGFRVAVNRDTLAHQVGQLVTFYVSHSIFCAADHLNKMDDLV